MLWSVSLAAVAGQTPQTRHSRAKLSRYDITNWRSTCQLSELELCGLLVVTLGVARDSQLAGAFSANARTVTRIQDAANNAQNCV